MKKENSCINVPVRLNRGVEALKPVTLLFIAFVVLNVFLENI